MNADETAKAPTNGAFQPITEGAQPTSAQQPVRRAGVLPGQGGAPGQPPATQAPATMPQSIPPAGSAPAGSFPPAGAVPAANATPTSGTVPQRNAFRPTTAPGAAAPATGAPPSVQPAGQPAARPAGQPQPNRAATAPFAPAGAATVTGVAVGSSVTTAPAPATTGAPTPASDAAGGLSIGDRFRGLTTKAKDGAKTQLEKADREVAVTAGSGPRKARVLVSRIDPWSSLKIAFLLSIAAGIMLVVAVHVLWNVLNGMGTFEMIQEWVSKLFTENQELNILQFVEYSKVMSATLLISVVNVVLLTGLAVVATFLYNIISRVVGGVYMTLTDD